MRAAGEFEPRESKTRVGPPKRLKLQVLRNKRRVSVGEKREDITRRRETDVWDPSYGKSIASVSMDSQGGVQRETGVRRP